MGALSDSEKTLLTEVLWDSVVDDIQNELNKMTIIERILQFGRPEHIRFMTDKYSKKDIRRVVRESVNIDRKTASYWSIRYEIPKKEIVCLKK